MEYRAFLLGGLFFMLFAGVSAAASVSYDSYIKSCNECGFDANGKMDKGCWEAIQGDATAGLGIAYPVMSFKYTFGGGCAPLDQCAAALSACKQARTSGNDARDCGQNLLAYCFRQADACAEAANKICAEGKSEEESGIKDVLSNMTAKKNETTEGNEEVVLPEEKGNNFFDDWVNLACGGPDFIMVFALAGALFYSRK